MNQHQLDRLKKLAERIRMNHRGQSHRLHITARIEDAYAIEGAIAELESSVVQPCTCGAGDVGDVLHATTCMAAVQGGEAGGA